ncbi:MAG: ABC-type transport auxiliary lipoprotein family protein [Deltaproteobacteria bacterium]|nr:ABC-type transport auxiliary lipoprotein family protein [Candidatus Deferrimicrobiaceae bacterium]
MPERNGRFRRIRWAAIPALLAAAAACTLLPTPKAVPRTTYLLRPDSPVRGVPVAHCPQGSGTLLVSVPREEPGFETTRMAYLPRPNTVKYYANSRWADSPAGMLAPALVEALEKTGCWHAVVRAPSALPADFRLDTEDLALEQEYFSRPSKVRLSLRATLVDLREPGILSVRRFEALEDAPSEDAEGGAIAAGRAAEKLLGSVAAWANAAARPGAASR